jgi:hypothetical protein
LAAIKRRKARCTLVDPSTRKGAKCVLQGSGWILTEVLTKRVRSRFNKYGIAKASLKLNAAGRAILRANGTLAVGVGATVTERDGTTTHLLARVDFGGAP